MSSPTNVSPLYYLALSLIGLFSFFVLWWVLTYFQWVSPLFLPSPKSVGLAIITSIQSGDLLKDAGMSILRILIGVCASLLFAFPVGISIGRSKKIEALIEPLIAFVRYIPPSAFIPLAIIWLGIGEMEKIVILLLGLAPYLTLIFANLVLQVRTDLIDVSLTLGATKRQVLQHVIIPSMLPHIWDTLRITFGAAWTYVIITEIVGANSGLGYLMVESSRFLRTDVVFAAVIVIGFLGLATDAFFKWTRPLLFSWV
jgi:NitT/TauT family transport system permease protein